jgi:hypothetical protein
VTDERLQQLERERAEEVAKAHDALAAAQDRSYWLDRWHVDLNALMRRPGAGLLRASFRVLRALYRLAYDTRNRSGKAVGGARERLVSARDTLQHEHTSGGDAVPPPAPRRLQATPVSDVLNGAVDGDDPRALAALARADAVVAALEQVGRGPRPGEVWLGTGPTAGEVLGVLRSAHPQLQCREQLEPGADAGFAIGGWTTAASALERLAALHAAIKPGGVLVLAAERGAGADVTPAWLAAHATPDWRVALYLPGGLEGDRDLYVLERA